MDYAMRSCHYDNKPMTNDELAPHAKYALDHIFVYT